MTLYISNPSRQDAVFYYRRGITKDSSGPAHVTIPSGGQVMLGGLGWNLEEQNYVVQQLIQQGGEDAAKAHGRMGRFSGLLYREEFPVDEDEILTAHESVKAAAEERSVVQVTRGALAFDRTVNKGRRGQRESQTTEVEIQQLPVPHQKPTGNEAHFKMTVDPDGSSDIRGIPGLA